MDVFKAIELRHSVRQYRPDPVPDEMLLKIVEAAHRAPSSWNLQPWEFVVVTDPELKKALRMAANNQAHVEEAGALFVCLGSLRQQDALADRIEAMIPPDATPERRERTMRTVNRMRQDDAFRRDHVRTNTYIAIAYLTLAATDLGLGSVWMGGFDPAKVKEILQIPDDFIVCSLVSVGWPAVELEPAPHKRRPLEQVYHWNGFGDPSMDHR